jgi:hypothetical protein
MVDVFIPGKHLTLTLSPLAGRGNVPRASHGEGRRPCGSGPSPRKRGEGGGSRMRGMPTNGGRI